MEEVTKINTEKPKSTRSVTSNVSYSQVVSNKEAKQIETSISSITKSILTIDTSLKKLSEDIKKFDKLEGKIAEQQKDIESLQECVDNMSKNMIYCIIDAYIVFMVQKKIGPQGCNMLSKSLEVNDFCKIKSSEILEYVETIHKKASHSNNNSDYIKQQDSKKQKTISND
jgi:hypothetical protein